MKSKVTQSITDIHVTKTDAQILYFGFILGREGEYLIFSIHLISIMSHNIINCFSIECSAQSFKKLIVLLIFIYNLRCLHKNLNLNFDPISKMLKNFECVCVCSFGVNLSRVSHYGRRCKYIHTLLNTFMLLIKIFSRTHNLEIVFFIYNMISISKLFVNNIFIQLLLFTIIHDLYFKVFSNLSIKPNPFLLIKLFLWSPGAGLSHLRHTHFDNNLAVSLNGDE